MKRVEYNLNNSEYNLSIGNLTFTFSSVFNKTRFELNYADFIEEETDKLRAKYGVNINLTEYLLVVFYLKIEKRGFKVLVHKENDNKELSRDYVFELDRM